MKVSWGYHSQYMENHKTCSKPPTRKCWWLRDGLWNWVCHITLRGNPPDFLVKLPLRIHPHFLAVPHVNGKSSFSTTIMTNIGTSSINRGFSIYLKRSTGNPKHDRFWSLLGWYQSNSHFSSHLTSQKSKSPTAFCHVLSQETREVKSSPALPHFWAQSSLGPLGNWPSALLRWGRPGVAWKPGTPPPTWMIYNFDHFWQNDSPQKGLY